MAIETLATCNPNCPILRVHNGRVEGTTLPANGENDIIPFLIVRKGFTAAYNPAYCTHPEFNSIGGSQGDCFTLNNT